MRRVVGRLSGRLRRAAAASFVGLALLGAGCSRGPVKVTLPTVPTTLQLREYTATTLGADHTSDSLPVASGDPDATGPTSTLAFQRGRVTVSGVVKGPDGPLSGATVHLERLVGDDVAAEDVVTDDSGRYRLADITGGRLRVRAWRAPDFAAVEPVVVFATGDFTLDLEVASFGTTAIRWGMAPRPGIVGRAVNVVVLVTREQVTDDGIVRPAPVSAMGVTITPLGLLQPDSSEEVVTNDGGKVQVTMRCNGIGNASLLIALATGERTQIDPPDCAPVPTTTLEPSATPGSGPVSAANTVPPADAGTTVPTSAPEVSVPAAGTVVVVTPSSSA